MGGKQSIMNYGINASFEPIFVINDRNIICLVNDTALEKFGWSREELIGQSIFNLFTKNEQKSNAVLSEMVGSGKSKEFKMSLKGIKKDGSKVSVEMWVKKMDDIETEETHFCCAIREEEDPAQELQVANTVLKEMYDNSFDSILLIDQGGVIQIANKTAEAQFGWSREKLVGMNVHELIANEKYSANHCTYIKKYMETGDRLYFMGARRYRLPMKRQDGTIFLAELGLKEFSATEKDGTETKIFGGFIRDQTREVEYEQKLRAKDEMTKSIFDSTPNPFLTINEHGLIQMVNRAACEIFGYYNHEFVGKDIKLIMEEKDAHMYLDYIKNNTDSEIRTKMENKTHELYVSKKDGSKVQVRSWVSELEDHDNALIIFMQDLSN